MLKRDCLRDSPPLEAVRLLLNDVATVRKARPNEDRVIMVNDVARAFFEAPMKRYACVELPPEARDGEQEYAEPAAEGAAQHAAEEDADAEASGAEGSTLGTIYSG